MERKRNELDFLPWSISTIDEVLGYSSVNNTFDDGPGTTCGNQPNDGEPPGTDGFTDPATISVACGSSGEFDPDAGSSDDVTDPGNRGGRDPNGTFIWDPQETQVPVLASTAGPSESSVPATAGCRAEAVPGFEILSELGRGGMGIVYKARQLRLKRLVALKVIRYDRNSNPEDLARFEIEAEVVARLNHPNIVRIYDIGRATGVPFVALELLEGGTLKDRLASTPQPVRESATLLATLARAVHAAHVAGVLHRDLKPSNVLFDRNGVPKIADFGLAKRLDVEESETMTGQVIGTPSYMAPEQASGWSRENGPAADIYSLGAILYEMLTGRPPIKGMSQAETIKLVLEEDPVSPSSLRPKVPFDLETICLKCIARDPRKRYADALGLADDVDRFLADEPILARRTPLWERAFKLAHRHPVISVVVAMSVVAIGVALAAAQHVAKRENDRLRSLVQSAEQEFFDAHEARAQRRWGDARRILSGLLSRIKTESDNRLVKLRFKAESLDEQSRRGSAEETAAENVRTQIRSFHDLRDEALFLDTRFGGLDRENALEATCRSARAGLAVFGVGGAGDLWVLAPLPPGLGADERDEVTNGFYELLLVLADAVSQSPGAEHRQRALQALRIIDRAPAVRSRATRAYHLRRSAYLEMNGDPDGAAHERDEAERLSPSDAFDFFLMGRELTRKSDWKAAITCFEAATQKQPDHFWAQCLLAICHLQVKEPSKARLGLNACLQQKNDRPWLYLLRGIANAGEGKRARDMAELYPDQATSLSAIATEQFEAAEDDYRTALELLGDSPSDAELHYVLLVNRGHIRLEREDLPAAAADLNEAIRRNGRRFEAFSGLAHVYQRQGRTDDALKQFARAIELQPKLAQLHRARADVYLGLETAAADLRDVVLHDLEDEIRNLTPDQRDAALRELELAIACELPGKHGIFAVDKTKQATLLHVAHRADEALQACVVALENAPRLALAHQLRIHLLLDLKQYDDLVHACDFAVKSIKPSAELFELRAMAKDGLEDYSGAIADYTLSLSLHPENPRVLRRRGWSFLADDANRPAAHDFDQAIRLAPNDADAFSGRGLARARLGRHDGATSDADQSLQLAETSWRIAYNAARTYAQSAVALDVESRKTGPAAARGVTRYLERAVNLVRLALELTPADQRSILLRETMMTDPALQPIKRRLKSLDGLNFEQQSRPQVSSAPG